MLAKKILTCAFLSALFVATPLARAESGRETSDTHPLNINKPIFRLSVSGRVTFEKESSYFRIVLVDKDLNEYLVYETYPLLTDSNSFAFNDVCQETCILDSVLPVSLKIFGEGATYIIDKIFSVDNPQQLRVADIAEEKKILRTKQEEQKIQKLNEQIKVKGMNWIAGKTPVSDLSYEEKKRLFRKEDGTPVDNLPNLQGFEYYKGGIFEIKSESPRLSANQEASPSALPASWDWRNVHGENWNTPVRNQGSIGSCWAHSILAAIESHINLYFNQHPNIDLSEQMLLDCIFNKQLPLGMDGSLYPSCNKTDDAGYACCAGSLYCTISNHGIAIEDCDHYAQRDSDAGGVFCNTNNICPDWENKSWKIGSYHQYSDVIGSCCDEQSYVTVEDFKKKLIKEGPMQTSYLPWNHGMLLEGYKTNADSETIWIFKNSWGVLWGDAGYAEIVNPNYLFSGFIPRGPFIPPPDRSFWPDSFDGEIKCVDKDNDGYCNWGISENKPDTCPTFCQPEKDCDDSDPILGPFDENFNCRFSCQNSAQGDLNCDNLINETDLTILLSRWGQPDSPAVQTLLQNWNVNI